MYSYHLKTQGETNDGLNGKKPGSQKNNIIPTDKDKLNKIDLN